MNLIETCNVDCRFAGVRKPGAIYRIFQSDKPPVPRARDFLGRSLTMAHSPHRHHYWRVYENDINSWRVYEHLNVHKTCICSAIRRVTIYIPRMEEVRAWLAGSMNKYVRITLLVGGLRYQMV